MAWKMINARAETVTTASAFRKALSASGGRLLRVEEGRKEKQPYMIANVDGTPMTLAGLWENWKERQAGK